MRDILFKAKRIDSGEWIFGNLLITDDDGVCIIQNHVPHHLLKQYEVDKNTICQFTGLTDKNGNEIWENDIVDGMFNAYKGRYIINWNEFCARFEFPTIARINTNEYKVIGNIFDNPELIGRTEF
jgi:uncharacterized phage protein (TIGR01671 family)